MMFQPPAIETVTQAPAPLKAGQESGKANLLQPLANMASGPLNCSLASQRGRGASPLIRPQNRVRTHAIMFLGGLGVSLTCDV